MSQVERVLIIDDSPRCARLLALAVASQGVSGVVEETRPGEAIQRIRDERPDLVLLDIKMPEVDGFQILESVRSQGNLVPVMMCSGSNLQGDVDRAYAIGCNGYISKPDSLDGYKQIASRVVDYWRSNLSPISQADAGVHAARVALPVRPDSQI